MYEDSLALLRASKSDFYDIFVEQTTLKVVEIKSGKVERMSVGELGGVGVRLTRGLSTLFASSTDSSESSVYSLARFLTGIAEPTEGVHLTTVAPEKGLELYGGYPAEDEYLKEIFETINETGYASDLIKQISITYSEKQRRVEIYNEQMKHLSQTLTYTTLFIEMTAKKGDVVQSLRRPLGVLGGSDYLKGVDFKGIVAGMRERLIELLDAPPLKAGKMSVVLSSSAGGTMIHEAVGHGLEADLVYESMSVYKDRVGQQVASPKISVVDDATRPGMRGSYLFDDEGTPAQNTLLIENGVLKGYMFDKTYAKISGMESTGNARRASFKHVPVVRMSNTYILPGNDDPEEIVASVDDGLLVKQMGGGQVNPVTGDFVFEVSEGYKIENGKVGHLVRGATLVGNGPKVLREIDMVGNDFGVEVGTCGKSGQGVPVTDGEPTLRIPSILVGGSAL